MPPILVGTYIMVSH